MLREKDEMNVKHGKAADELKASLNTVMAERDRSQAAEETMRIASSEQKEAVEQKLMSQLDTVQKDLQKSREAYGSVKAERDRLKDEVVKTQEGLAELRGQQTTLNNNLAMLKGVNETLQLTTQKVKSLEGKVEEKEVTVISAGKVYLKVSLVENPQIVYRGRFYSYVLRRAGEPRPKNTPELPLPPKTTPQKPKTPTPQIKSNWSNEYPNKFLKGLASGLGWIIGATILVSLLTYILSQIEFIPILGEIVSQLIEEIESFDR